MRKQDPRVPAEVEDYLVGSIADADAMGGSIGGKCKHSSVVLNAHNRVHRVRCFHVEREPVVLPVPTSCALVYDGKAFAAWLRDRDRPHRRTAFASAIPRSDVDVQ